MTLTAKISNTFKCDLPECDQMFDYNPQPQPPETWPQGVQIALTKIVQVAHPLSMQPTAPGQMPNPPKLFCCDEHAIEGIKRKLHLPALPPKIVPASSDADVRAAAAGANAVTEMKGPRVKRH